MDRNVDVMIIFPAFEELKKQGRALACPNV